MTDKVHSLTVVFEEDIREDSCGQFITAIMMFKNVLSVRPNVSDVSSYIAEARAKAEIARKLFKVVYPISGTVELK